jgi:F-type H+-transporting ATPase subunit a
LPDINQNWKMVAQAGGEHKAGEGAGSGEHGGATGGDHGAAGAGAHPVAGGTHASAGHGGEHGGEHGAANPLTHHSPWEFSISGLIVAGLLVAFAAAATAKMTKIPRNKLQSLAETITEGINSFCEQSIGPGGKRFTPLIGTLFLYILGSNLVGALPLAFKDEGPGKVGPYGILGPLGAFIAPTANLSMNFAMALIVFVTFNVVALKSQGLVGRLKHLWGPIWWLGFLLFPLEIISELIRPLSLSFRLFGNIFGEEMMVAAIIGLVASIPLFGWLPLHLPLVLFGLLTAVVQAGVFCLLTCIYLRMAMDSDHGDHGEHGHDAHGHADDHAHTPAPAH